MKLSKIQIKLNNDSDLWTHFCYVPLDIKHKFDMFVNVNGYLSNYWIEGWASDEFNLIAVDTPEGLKALKEAIKNKYKEDYPELYIESVTDNQGWLRVWYTKNMIMEMNNLGLK